MLILFLLTVYGSQLLPFSVGVETRGGVMTTVLERGLQLPARNRVLLTNVNTEVKELKLGVFVGNRAFCKDNRLGCELVMGGLSTGDERNEIEVTVSLDNTSAPVVVDLAVSRHQIFASCRFQLPTDLEDESNFEILAINEVRDEDALQSLKLSEAEGDFVPMERLRGRNFVDYGGVGDGTKDEL